MFIICAFLAHFFSSTAAIPPPSSLYIHIINDPSGGQTLDTVPFRSSWSPWSPQNNYTQTPAASDTLPSVRMGHGFAFDNKLTVGPSYNSLEIGRFQGFTIHADMNGTSLAIVGNLHLHGHQGYIHMAGWVTSSLWIPYNEVLILGGTGDFEGILGTLRARFLQYYGKGVGNWLLHGELDYHF